MPGKETVRNRSGVPRSAVRIVVILLAVVAAGWILSHAVGAANRHQLAHPARSLPENDERTAYEYGVAPQDILGMLTRGEPEGVSGNGTRVTLALDEDLQKDIFGLFRRFDPPYGIFVAMEPDTGRVLALVGYRKGGEADPTLPLKAIYPAASLIKVVTASAALEEGKITSASEISYRGGIYGITRKGIHARDGRGVPTMSLEEAIARSANSVFGKVAVNYVGSDNLLRYMGKFGFGQPIPFCLPVEISKCEVPRDEYNLARTGAGFGEVYVSPLHMAMIMSAVGAYGEMPRPVLIDRVTDRDGAVLYESSPSKLRETVLPETADTLLQMMVKTIEIGTSRRTFGTPESTPLLQDMEVAGKTGSLSGWNPRMHFEWFAGVAPAGDPKLAVAALVVNDNRGRIKGSYVGKEAFNTYFGYPQSTPPSYARGRAKAHWKKVSRKAKGARPYASGKRGKKGSKRLRGHRSSLPDAPPRNVLPG